MDANRCQPDKLLRFACKISSTLMNSRLFDFLLASFLQKPPKTTTFMKIHCGFYKNIFYISVRIYVIAFLWCLFEISGKYFEFARIFREALVGHVNQQNWLFTSIITEFQFQHIIFFCAIRMPNE